jgi:hypothetical protein
VKIKRTSILSGVTRTREIDVTFEQLYKCEVEGKNIQQVMPNLTASEREFIMTGITQDEWDAAFSDEDG